MILKASAANGSSSPQRRSTTSSEFGFTPLVGGTSRGEGRKSTTASSSGCTPLFLNAEPHNTGTSLPLSVPLRMHRLSVASSGSWPPR